MRNTYLRLAATIPLLLAIALEVNHSLIRQVAWKGFETAANFVSVPLILTWALAIAGIWSANAALKPWLVLGIIFLITHGIVISTGGNSLAAAYLLSGILAGVCGGLAHAIRERPLRARERPNLRIAS